MGRSGVGSTREVNDKHSEIPTSYGFLCQDRVCQGSGSLSGYMITPLSRQIRAQQGGTRILDCGIGTPCSGNVPKRSYHNDNARNPKILLQHSRVHACRWYVSHQYGTNQGYSIIDGRRKPTGRVSSGARGIVSHWVIPEGRKVILVLAVIPIDLQVANIATLK